MKIYQEAEKFINDMFWTDTHDKDSNLNISELVEAKLLQDDKEKDPEYYNPRLGVVHASQLYGCLRGTVHKALCHKPTQTVDARKLGVFKAGNLFEDYIVEALGERVIGSQTEYEYKYKNITLVGRSDYRIKDNDVIRIGENKSVHSDAFWYRQQEGTLVQWHNQIQLQIYMWLERILDRYMCDDCAHFKMSNQPVNCPECGKPMRNDGKKPDKIYPQGIFSYISKDDCTVASAAVKFNQAVIDEIVIPSMDIVSDAVGKRIPLIMKGRELKKEYEEAVKKAENSGNDGADVALADSLGNELKELWKQINDLSEVPLPEPAVYAPTKNQWQVNWLAKYCDHHDDCAGKGWLLEAQDIVKRKNIELRNKTAENFPHLNKKKPTITVVG